MIVSFSIRLKNRRILSLSFCLNILLHCRYFEFIRKKPPQIEISSFLFLNKTSERLFFSSPLILSPILKARRQPLIVD